MKKSSLFILLLSGVAFSAKAESYNDFKAKLHNDYGFDYVAKVAYLAQRGAPSGKNTVRRTKYEIEAGLDLFSDTKYGSGSIQFSYDDMDYVHDFNGMKLGQRIGVGTPINDDPTQIKYLKRLTYTHRLGGDLNKLSLSVGNFVIGQFYKTDYRMKDINHFNALSFAKNITRSHAVSDFGAYATYDFTPQFRMSAGAQNQRHYLAQGFMPHSYNSKKWTDFLQFVYQPQWFDFGKTNITGWVYHTPKFERNGYNKQANGFMFLANQNINKFSATLKIAGASGDRMPMKNSYNLMLAYNNPFDRNSMDQIGLGFAYNRLSKLYKNQRRGQEYVSEFYYNFGITDFISITPDIEFYYHPALTNRDTDIVTSLTLKLYL